VYFIGNYDCRIWKSTICDHFVHFYYGFVECFSNGCNLKVENRCSAIVHNIKNVQRTLIKGDEIYVMLHLFFWETNCGCYTEIICIACKYGGAGV
jgi:hypothetical protein